MKRSGAQEPALAAAIRGVLAANPGEVQRFRAGEEKVFGFLVGAVMRETKGRANPQVVNRMLRDMLAG